MRLSSLATLLLVTSSSIAAAQSGPPTSVTFSGSPQSPISSAVAVPAGKAYFWTSGTVPPAVDRNAAAGSRERFGDTKTQAQGILRNFETMLKERGLALKDVVYLRVYLVADKHKNNVPDYQGWFDAYGEFFGTAANPTKPARSTLAVAGLVNADWLIEIELVAVYP
jgi:enamine deaminase RidA (YjgF/YER057c/UK114 family)